MKPPRQPFDSGSRAGRSTRRVALYGGSFDPPHLGHVLAVCWALSAHAVDEVWVLPVFTHRFGKTPAPFAARMRWCEAAFACFGDRVTVSDAERVACDAGGSGSTFELVEHLRDRGTVTDRTELQLLMGSDQLGALDKWHRSTELFARVRPLVIGRAGHDAGRGAGVVVPDVSSTAVRRELAGGTVPRAWLPAAVADMLSVESPYCTAGDGGSND